jgi:transposase
MKVNELQVAVDVGARMHRVAVGDEAGRLLEEFDLAHTPAGFAGFFTRIERLRGTDKAAVSVAMEGYNGWARPLDSEVLAHGWKLYNVNNLKLARYKEIFPAPAKTDAIDARRILELFRLRSDLPVARGVLQQIVALTQEAERLKRLTRRRRQLVNEKVRVVNRMHSDLQAVCPGLLAITTDVDNLWFLSLLGAREDIRKLARVRPDSLRALEGVGRTYCAKIQAWQREALFSHEAEWAGPMIVADAKRVLALKNEIAALDELIEPLTDACEGARRLRTMPGFGRVCSAELAGEIGAIERFGSEASLALYLGMAVLDDSSGTHTGTKRSRQVNRRAKAAMMIAVARHMEQVPRSRAYYDKKRAQGKTHNQAVRALGRQLVRVIWSMLKHQRDYKLR